MTGTEGVGDNSVDRPRRERGPVTVQGCVDQNDSRETGCGWEVFEQ